MDTVSLVSKIGSSPSNVSVVSKLNGVSPLAYEPELPPSMKIHPVISVTNLEPLTPGEDPYKRPFNDHPPPVEDDQDIDEEWKSFSIEKLLDRRLRRYGRGKKIIEYLVKWTGYGPRRSAR